MDKQVLKLNIGCGSRLLLGYINIDLYTPPSIPNDCEFRKGDARDLSWLLDASVDEIRAEFILEHLNLPEALEILYQFWRVLKKAGRLYILVPDFGTVANTILQSPDDLIVSLYASFFLLNSFINDNCADSSSPHKSLWTKQSLKRALDLEGFEVETMNNVGKWSWGLSCWATKGIKLGEEE